MYSNEPARKKFHINSGKQGVKITLWDKCWQTPSSWGKRLPGCPIKCNGSIFFPYL